MSFIEKIKNTFYVDKWWGKTIVWFLAYVLLWAICFGSILLVPYDSLVTFASRYRKIVPFYIFGFFPVISFLILYFLNKALYVKKLTLFIVHVVVNAAQR
jgi:hypothetical protein